MLTWQKYDIEVDIWSAGCIFAEMLEGKPLFPGKDHVNQFSIITDLLGTPPDDVIKTICSENVGPPANSFVAGLTFPRPFDSSNPYPSASVNRFQQSSKMPIHLVSLEKFQ